ncbi:MAG: alanine--tRNA ligase [Anaerolineales bacterium]|nr:alanine--tRNA ligase [Anaerolineales bacterium]
MPPKFSGAQIRQTYLDFFVEHGHTVVPSASLVPGGDATLLFTNAGMVQFKDVFLGADKRPYTRAVDSQKCLRVAGKHNDLDEVGCDDTHHTFFEMLGNWSFGDYYKKEAIQWAWQLLTDVWGLPRERLWATVFKDDKGNVPADEEAANFWRKQPGFQKEHVLYFGRKDNFWEMAETGPCGPCSEIHMDRGEEYCNLKGRPHNCTVNGDCTRYLELWNLVFIQYNRMGPDTLNPLPATHVDTGMGFERIVSVLQDVDSNYKTDLFAGALAALRSLTGHSEAQMLADFTPYRVIADHARSAAFLIADGVVPGNTGRNYVCRMIIRRAARFGTKIDLHEPFLAKVAEAFIAAYIAFYPELEKHKTTILDSMTREEIRFARTVESGVAVLDGMFSALRKQKKTVLEGSKAFELYATYGLPFEITRDIAREQNLDVDESGFRAAMDKHRLASGGGKAMGALGGEDAEFFSGILRDLQAKGKLGESGVEQDPYASRQVASGQVGSRQVESKQVEDEVLALFVNGEAVQSASFGDLVEVILPKTGFYIESGGQVSDTGFIRTLPLLSEKMEEGGGGWEIEITDMRRPAAGIIIHIGEVVFGHPKVGDKCIAEVDMARRHDIMRNHTATHLLHSALHQVLGEHARQAGSLVAPDRLRFDFNHPEAMTAGQLERVEKIVNDAVTADMPVQPVEKSRQQAIDEGAMALFGEKYGETVRTITISALSGSSTAGYQVIHSYELCSGTHLERTGDVGAFIIVSEGSAAAGVRRIEAVTGRGAYELIAERFRTLKQTAALLSSAPEGVAGKVASLLDELVSARKQISSLRQETALSTFNMQLANVQTVNDVNLLAIEIPNADKDTLGKLADSFREKYPQNGVCVVAAISGEQIVVMAAVTQDLIKKGIKAGDLVNHISRQLGAGGGGSPHLAFGGGRDASKLPAALASVRGWVEEKLK